MPAAIGPHEFKRLHWLRRNECAACYVPKNQHNHPFWHGWREARPFPLYTWRWYLFGKES